MSQALPALRQCPSRTAPRHELHRKYHHPCCSTCIIGFSIMVELSITEIVDHLRSNGIGRNGNLMSGKAKQGNIREGTFCLSYLLLLLPLLLLLLFLSSSYFLRLLLLLSFLLRTSKYSSYFFFLYSSIELFILMKKKTYGSHFQARAVSSTFLWI